MIMNTKGQVWIETVIYLLIGLGVIGVLLAFIKPQIDNSIDKNFIEKSIESLNKIDSTINEVSYVTGNSRSLVLALKRGKLDINSTSDTISMTIEDSKYEYSEIGKEVNISGTRMKVLTSETNGRKDVALTLSYGDYYNITVNGNETNKEVQTSETPYNLIIKNNGGSTQTNIDLVVEGWTNEKTFIICLFIIF